MKIWAHLFILVVVVLLPNSDADRIKVRRRSTRSPRSYTKEWNALRSGINSLRSAFEQFRPQYEMLLLNFKTDNPLIQKPQQQNQQQQQRQQSQSKLKSQKFLASPQLSPVGANPSAAVIANPLNPGKINNIMGQAGQLAQDYAPMIRTAAMLTANPAIIGGVTLLTNLIQPPKV